MHDLAVGILESFLGSCRHHNEDNGQISFDCPACALDKGLLGGDGKGNLEVNYHLNKFKCWACSDVNNMHGSVPKLIKRFGNKDLLSTYLLVKPDAWEVKAKVYDEITVELPDEFVPLTYVNRRAWKFDEAMTYVRFRGLTDSIIERYGIGYCPKGDYFNRIIIPSYNRVGDLDYFVGRWFGEHKPKNPYKNPQVEKQTVIFNEGLINWDAPVNLVEGPLDHVVVPNSIPLLGKFDYPLLIDTLQDNALWVNIFLDGDAMNDAYKLFNEINFGNLNGRVRIIPTPTDHDPSSIFKRYGHMGIAKVMKTAYTPSVIETI